MQSMICPICGGKLDLVQPENVAWCECANLHGQAVTLPGVRSLCSNSKFANMLWQKAYNQTQENPSKLCPSCRKPMKSVPLELNGSEVLELDICCRCQLVWFDSDELDKLPKEVPVTTPDAELPQQARTIMALHQVQEQSRGVVSGYDDEPENPWQYLAGIMGFPIEQNMPALRSTPYITWLLVLICLTVFGFTFSNPEAAAANWGFIPEQWMRKGGFTLLSSVFIHADLWHLLGNMYFLLIFGDNVEDFIGKKRYLLLIVLSELFSTLLYIIFARNGAVPCVGASGFISGVIALYAVLFPQVRIVFCSRYFCTFHWWGMPAWVLFTIWIIMQSVLAVLSAKVSNVAYTAHIGGALLGLLAGFIIRRQQKKQFSASAKNPPAAG